MNNADADRDQRNDDGNNEDPDRKIFVGNVKGCGVDGCALDGDRFKGMIAHPSECGKKQQKISALGGNVSRRGHGKRR